MWWTNYFCISFPHYRFFHSRLLISSFPRSTLLLCLIPSWLFSPPLFCPPRSLVTCATLTFPFMNTTFSSLSYQPSFSSVPPSPLFLPHSLHPFSLSLMRGIKPIVARSRARAKLWFLRANSLQALGLVSTIFSQHLNKKLIRLLIYFLESVVVQKSFVRKVENDIFVHFPLNHIVQIKQQRKSVILDDLLSSTRKTSRTEFGQQ